MTVSDKTSIFDYATSNCIHVLICKSWPSQYVLEASQKLRRLFNLHRLFINETNKVNICERQWDYFQKGVVKELITQLK